MIIEDNLLDMEDYDLLESIIDNPFFQWFFQKEQVKDDDPFFCHALYCNDLVQSKFYKPILDIFKKYIKYESGRKTLSTRCRRWSWTTFISKF